MLKVQLVDQKIVPVVVQESTAVSMVRCVVQAEGVLLGSAGMMVLQLYIMVGGRVGSKLAQQLVNPIMCVQGRAPAAQAMVIGVLAGIITDAVVVGVLLKFVELVGTVAEEA